MACAKKKCIAVNVGDLKHKVTIEQETSVSDGAGGITSTWATYKTAWCSIDPIKASEWSIAMQNETRRTHKIIMRYTAGITDKMRVNFEGRYFNIVEVLNPLEQNIRLELMCIEGLAT